MCLTLWELTEKCRDGGNNDVICNVSGCQDIQTCQENGKSTGTLNTLISYLEKAGDTVLKDCACVYITMEVLCWIEYCQFQRNLVTNLWGQIIGPVWCSTPHTPKGLLIQL